MRIFSLYNIFLSIHKLSLGSCEVPHKIWARSVSVYYCTTFVHLSYVWFCPIFVFFLCLSLSYVWICPVFVFVICLFFPMFIFVLCLSLSYVFLCPMFVFVLCLPLSYVCIFPMFVFVIFLSWPTFAACSHIFLVLCVSRFMFVCPTFVPTLHKSALFLRSVYCWSLQYASKI